MDSFLHWHGCHRSEGLIWSPWIFFQAVCSWINESSCFLSWKWSEKIPLSRVFLKITGKHIENCKCLINLGLFALWTLGIFLFSALASLLTSSTVLCFHNCPEFLWEPSLFFCVALCPFEVHWLRHSASRGAAEIGDGWQAGTCASCCLFWKLVKKKWTGNVCSDLGRAKVGQDKVAAAGCWETQAATARLWQAGNWREISRAVLVKSMLSFYSSSCSHKSHPVFQFSFFCVDYSCWTCYGGPFSQKD